MERSKKSAKAGGAKKTGVQERTDAFPLLSEGTVYVVRSEHPDAVDEYELQILSEGAEEIRCVAPGGEESAFRAIFTKSALTAANGLLAISQFNPHCEEEGTYHGPDEPRAYTFDRTTPPFLLSHRLAAAIATKESIEVCFYAFLDDDPRPLHYEGTLGGDITFDGRRVPVTLDRYACRERDFELDVVSGTPLVVRASRDCGEFEMALVEIRTAGSRTEPSRAR